MISSPNIKCALEAFRVLFRADAHITITHTIITNGQKSQSSPNHVPLLSGIENLSGQSPECAMAFLEGRCAKPKRQVLKIYSTATLLVVAPAAKLRVSVWLAWRRFNERLDQDDAMLLRSDGSAIPSLPAKYLAINICRSPSLLGLP